MTEIKKGKQLTYAPNTRLKRHMTL